MSIAARALISSDGRCIKGHCTMRIKCELSLLAKSIDGIIVHQMEIPTPAPTLTYKPSVAGPVAGPVGARVPRCHGIAVQ